MIIICLLFTVSCKKQEITTSNIAASAYIVVEQFVELMNQKAKQLNLLNTYFSNPHGLDEEDDGNISTAYDMVILYSYCAENEFFNTITSSKSFDTFTNKNRLLKSYEYCTGGKTGKT